MGQDLNWWLCQLTGWVVLATLLCTLLWDTAFGCPISLHQSLPLWKISGGKSDRVEKTLGNESNLERRRWGHEHPVIAPFVVSTQVYFSHLYNWLQSRFYIAILFIYFKIWWCCCWWWSCLHMMCVSVCMKVWRWDENLGNSVHFFHHVVLGIELRFSAWWQAPLPTEIFCWPYVVFLYRCLFAFCILVVEYKPVYFGTPPLVALEISLPLTLEVMLPGFHY